MRKTNTVYVKGLVAIFILIFLNCCKMSDKEQANDINSNEKEYIAFDQLTDSISVCIRGHRIEQAKYYVDSLENKYNVEANDYEKARILFYKGWVFLRLKYLVLSEKNLYEALQIAKSTNDSLLLADIYLRYGSLKFENAEIEAFDENIKMSFYYAKKYHQKRLEVRAYNNFGIIAQKQKRTKEAIHFYNKCIKEASSDSTSLYDEMITAWFNLGLLKIELNAYQDAKSCFEQVNILSNIFNKHDAITNSYCSLSLIEIKQQNYHLAKSYVDTGYALAIKYKYLELEAGAIELFAKIAVANNDYKAAFNHQKTADSLRIVLRTKGDIERNELNNVIVNQLENKAKLEILEAENLSQKTRINTMGSAIGLGIALSLVVMFVLYLLLRIKEQKRRAFKLLSEKRELLLSEREIKHKRELETFLFEENIRSKDEVRKEISSQIHDSLAGSLAALKLHIALSCQNEGFEPMVQEVIGKIDQIYEMARDISHKLFPPDFEGKTFINAISDVLFLAEITGKVKTEITYFPEKGFDNIPVELKYDAFLVLRELIQNTLKHAEAKKIEINLTLHDNFLNIIFEDDGKGLLLNTNGGIGLKSMKNRIDARNGQFLIENKVGGGILVTLDLPL